MKRIILIEVEVMQDIDIADLGTIEKLRTIYKELADIMSPIAALFEADNKNINAVRYGAHPSDDGIVYYRFIVDYDESPLPIPNVDLVKACYKRVVEILKDTKKILNEITATSSPLKLIVGVAASHDDKCVVARSKTVEEILKNINKKAQFGAYDFKVGKELIELPGFHRGTKNFDKDDFLTIEGEVTVINASKDVPLLTLCVKRDSHKKGKKTIGVFALENKTHHEVINNLMIGQVLKVEAHPAHYRFELDGEVAKSYEVKEVLSVNPCPWSLELELRFG